MCTTYIYTILYTYKDTVVVHSYSIYVTVKNPSFSHTYLLESSVHLVSKEDVQL